MLGFNLWLFTKPESDPILETTVVVRKEADHLRLKRECGIPDSMPWGHYKIFLYEAGVKRVLAKQDSIINYWRDSVRKARDI